MRKLTAGILTIGLLLTCGNAVGAENNGKHLGWNNPKNPHYVQQDSLEMKLNSLLGNTGIVTSIKQETYVNSLDGKTYPKITVETANIDSVNYLFNSHEVYSVMEQFTGLELYTPGSSPSGLGVEFYFITPYVQQFPGLQEELDRFANELGLTVSLAVSDDRYGFSISIDLVNEDDKENMPALVDYISQKVGSEVNVNVIQWTEDQASYIITLK
ncbi:hypothetical protein [Neobacillus niacini]|uniref:hypothetical protein n=1 Tax=Neobacillus niacini TaxID=86668 RepID=UPI003983099A